MDNLALVFKLVSFTEQMCSGQMCSIHLVDLMTLNKLHQVDVSVLI